MPPERAYCPPRPGAGRADRIGELDADQALLSDLLGLRIRTRGLQVWESGKKGPDSRTTRLAPTCRRRSKPTCPRPKKNIKTGTITGGWGGGAEAIAVLARSTVEVPGRGRGHERASHPPVQEGGPVSSSGVALDGCETAADARCRVSSRRRRRAPRHAALPRRAPGPEEPACLRCLYDPWRCSGCPSRRSCQSLSLPTARAAVGWMSGGPATVVLRGAGARPRGWAGSVAAAAPAGGPWARTGCGHPSGAAFDLRSPAERRETFGQSARRHGGEGASVTRPCRRRHVDRVPQPSAIAATNGSASGLARRADG